ncbi:MAG: fumarylacetoacetate hydrolase family protein [Ekhidna sp.]|nr:fumarylacetoacetate hydrolase family protein [Ekhidna sp.]
MKLIRFGAAGSEKPGVEVEGKRYDVSNIVRDYDEEFFAGDGLQNLAKIFDTSEAEEVSTDVRLGCPVARPGKIVCIGLNYRNHAKEAGMDVPEEPVVFFKATSSIVGPNDDVVIPKNSEKTDWEVELAVVIGKRANYVEKADAMDHVAGYCLHNDVSERGFQLERGGQWVKGKSCDTFAPLGPYVVTKDEVKDPHNLNLWLTVNGEKHQDGNTNDFIFDIPEVVSYLSQFMSLMPGDIISTGTPEGVGFGYKPPVYLKDGDVMELGIEGLGSSRQEVKAWS